MCTAPQLFEEQSLIRRTGLQAHSVQARPRGRCTTSAPRLLDSARAGDREALARLLMPYATGLYLSALRVTGNPSDAEDVRQDALLRAVSRLRQFAGSQSEERDDLQAWVGRIGTNASIDVIRRRKEGKLFSLEHPAGDTEETLGSGIATREDNPEERLARKEMRSLLAESITQLPADLRQVCLLQDVLHYSTQEVAERLGISAVAVRLRLFRARRKLRDKMRHRMRFPQARAVCSARANFRSQRRYEFAGSTVEFVCGD
jgi:RNA polymerase sigma-70 factor, ECF subfamily